MNSVGDTQLICHVTVMQNRNQNLQPDHSCTLANGHQDSFCRIKLSQVLLMQHESLLGSNAPAGS